MKNRLAACTKTAFALFCIIILMISCPAKAQLKITPVSNNIIIALDTTGNKAVLLSEVATISGSTSGNPSVQISPANFNCSNLGPQTVTVTARDAGMTASLQVPITVVSPLVITYPISGVFTVPAYGNCIGIMPDFSKVMKVKKNCSTSVSFKQSEFPNFGVSIYSTDTSFVTLSATDNLGNVDSVRVKVIARPDTGGVSQITSSDSAICAGKTVTFTSDLQDPLFGQWTINKQLVPGAYGKTLSSDQLKNGDEINYTVQSACGGPIYSNTIRIRVFPATLPVLTITSLKPNICPGSTAAYYTKLSYPLDHKTYSWQVNGSPLAITDSAFVTSSLKNGDLLSCSVTGDTPCLGKVTTARVSYAVQIDSMLTPSITITPSDTSICSGTAAVFTAKAISGGIGAGYSWRINGHDAGVHATTFITAALVSGDVVDCVLSSPQSCYVPVVSSGSTIKVNPSPQITFGALPELSPGASLRLEPLITGTIRSYQWSPVIGLDDPTARNPVARPAKKTTYQLDVISANGCEATASVVVKVSSALIIPNTFTPNGDGINDTWNIAGLSDEPSCEVSVYNRYGQTVFHSAGYPSAWDGRFNGSPLSAGVYYYVIKANINVSPQAGPVTIVR